MAGLGRRVFAAGEVLTAGNVMGYLQDQAVMNFAGTAARGSAIGTAVAEGMVSYRQDTNDVEVYTGSLWQMLKGTVAQVVIATTTTQVSTSSSTYIDTGLAGTITPKYAGSTIVVFASLSIGKLGDPNATWQIGLKRDSGTPVDISDVYGGYGAASQYVRDNTPIFYSYSAGSTSSTTIKPVFRRTAGTDNVRTQVDTCMSQIILFEVVN